ncbi:MAG TPA: P-loop NTPase fold protein [Cyclobacteriaceae bacterium]|nr:P-loop NTPase fold protein [Cyclobacteriaceae bacterium]
MKRAYTIGITGGSGSGKTYFLNGLASQFASDEICVLSQDNYYKPITQQRRDDNGIENFDLPTAIDRDAFHVDVQKLRSGVNVSRAEYTFNNPKAEPTILHFKAAPLLVVEGLFVQYFEEIEKELDLKIFIEAKPHVKIARRIKRDQVERGYDINDVLYRYEFHVMPVYENLIEPLKHSSDLVIPNNGHTSRALGVLIEFLKSKLAVSEF